MQAALAAVSVHKARMHKLSNMMPLISFALKLVKQHGLALVPTDKDGGYCIMDISAWKRDHEIVDAWDRELFKAEKVA